MYKVEFIDGSVKYFDNIVYIKKHSNGCLVPCAQTEAMGVCLKMIQENEEEQDVPYFFEEYSSFGEVVSYIKEINTKEELDELNEIINILAGGISL